MLYAGRSVLEDGSTRGYGASLEICLDRNQKRLPRHAYFYQHRHFMQPCPIIFPTLSPCSEFPDADAAVPRSGDQEGRGRIEAHSATGYRGTMSVRNSPAQITGSRIVAPGGRCGSVQSKHAKTKQGAHTSQPAKSTATMPRTRYFG